MSMKKLLFAMLILAGCNRPEACFTPDTNITLNPNHTFTFTNCSENAETYDWQIETGNGEYFTTISESPTYNFGKRGIFNITLRANGNDNTNTYSSTVTVANMFKIQRILIPDSMVVYTVYDHDSTVINGYDWSYTIPENARFPYEIYPQQDWSTASSSAGVTIQFYLNKRQVNYRSFYTDLNEIRNEYTFGTGVYSLKGYCIFTYLD